MSGWGDVMPALVAGIHVFLCFKTWMAGTSPAMTVEKYILTIFLRKIFLRLPLPVTEGCLISVSRRGAASGGRDHDFAEGS
jgi:hypothetical protein